MNLPDFGGRTQASYSGNPPRLIDTDAGAVGQEGGCRRLGQTLAKLSGIEVRNGAANPGAFRTPHVPRRVLHLILDSTAIPLAAIPPVVFGDEFLVTPGN